MKIHNLMEEIVVKEIDEFFRDKEAMEKMGACGCEQCRTDVACFVLNRLTPKYVASGRGLAHVETEYFDDPQSITDVVSLVNEGTRLVSSRRRHGNEADTLHDRVGKGPYFNFPVIEGRIFHGKTFEPVADLPITLLLDNEPMAMFNTRWPNPYKLSGETSGCFLFWPLPRKAEKAGENRVFELELSLNQEGYNPLKHFIELELTAEHRIVDSLSDNNTLKTSDLYLFPEGGEEEDP